MEVISSHLSKWQSHIILFRG